MRNYNLKCTLVVVDFVLAKAPNTLFGHFLTVFAVFSCEYFLAGANVAVFFVKGNALAVVLTRQVATWRLQKKKIIIIINYALRQFAFSISWLQIITPWNCRWCNEARIVNVIFGWADTTPFWQQWLFQMSRNISKENRIPSSFSHKRIVSYKKPTVLSFD